MKILAVSDQVIERLYTPYVRQTYPDVRMILGCGDLPYNYLEFLVTIFNVPLFYVPGNHDPAYEEHPAARVEGGINLDGEVMYHGGWLMAGLGGSIMYHPNTPNQYTQSQMTLRAWNLIPKIYWMQVRHGKRLDFLVTHSPPAGIHDDEDPAHQGLRAINMLLRLFRPRYLFHGHTIFYQQNLRDHIDDYHGVKVVNIYPFRVMEIDAFQR